MVRYLRYNYTTYNLGVLRGRYNLRQCYKPSLAFLKGQDLVSKNLSNRIAINSNFVKSYRQLRMFYIKFLRANFINTSPKFLKKYKYTVKNSTFFVNVYKQTSNMNDLDRVLLWRAAQVNSIFNLKQKEVRKKKKYIYTSRITFNKPNKRVLIVWKWLNTLIKSFTIAKQPWEVALQPSLENFLLTPDNEHVITDVKFQVYKLQLLRTS